MNNTRDILCPRCEQWKVNGGDFTPQFLPQPFYHITEANDEWIISYHLVSYDNQDREVYYEYQVTYFEISDSPADHQQFLPVHTLWIDMGANCSSDFEVETGQGVQINSRKFSSPVDGTIIQCCGHVHKYATELTFKVNNETVCTSLPTYIEGNGGFIDRMSICPTTFPVRKNQTFEIISVYDKTEHLIDAMGIMVCYISLETPAKK